MSPWLAALVLVCLGLGVVVVRRGLQRFAEPEPLVLRARSSTLVGIIGTPLSVGLGLLVARLTRRLAPSLTLSSLAPTVGVVAFFLCLVTSLGLAFLVRARSLRAGPDAGLASLRLPGKIRGVPWFFAALLGALFLALTFVTLRLPVLPGTQYNLGHELIRLSALLSGLGFLLGGLGALLPVSLDLLERQTFVPCVAARHVRASKGGFLTVISFLSIFGVFVSSCALCNVVSVMGGFGQDLKRKILGNNAHLVVDMPAQLTGFSDYAPMVERVRKVPGVEAATPIVAGEAMASSNANTAGALVRGIDPATIGGVLDVVHNVEYGSLSNLVDEEALLHLPPDAVIGAGPRGELIRKGPDLSALYPGLTIRRPEKLPGIVIGRELAKSLHLLVGDELTLVSPLGDLGPMGVLPRARRFRVAAIFYSGMYEFDASHVYLRMDVAQAFFSLEHKITGIEIRSVDPETTEALVPRVTAAVGDASLRVRDWREMNKNLFSALKLERYVTFIILSLAVIIASFCIVCTLLLMVTEKSKEIAILKALGATDRSILSIFLGEGVIIGTIGTAFGVATGVAMCVGLKWFGVRLDPDVYYIDRLPVATNPSDYATIAVSAILICTVVTIFPATAAAGLRPVDGLRHE